MASKELQESREPVETEEALVSVVLKVLLVCAV